MKRVHLLLSIFTALLVVWLWLSDKIESKLTWLSIPVFIAGLFGAYSAIVILKSVLSLKDHPAEGRNLGADISRARDFYSQKNIKV